MKIVLTGDVKCFEIGTESLDKITFNRILKSKYINNFLYY